VSARVAITAARAVFEMHRNPGRFFRTELTIEMAFVAVTQFLAVHDGLPP
jgi:hypothetical protein